MRFKFFKKRDGKVIVNAASLEILVPREYFDTDIAEISGDKLIVLGIFRFRVRMDPKSQPTLYTVNIPSPLSIQYSSEHSLREAVGKDKDKIPYRVFTLERGDVFLESETIVTSAKNVESFVKLLHSGKLPTMVYADVYRQYMQVQDDNETSLGVSSATLEAIVSELCRYEKDHDIPFRLALAKAGTTERDFEMVTLKTLPELTSTFSGISFENVNKALASSVNNKRKKKKEKITPMEAAIRR